MGVLKTLILLKGTWGSRETGETDKNMIKRGQAHTRCRERASETDWHKYDYNIT